jgi:hypothetical protein
MATQSLERMNQNASEEEFTVVRSRKRKLKPETETSESGMDTSAPPKKPHFPPISGDKLTVSWLDLQYRGCSMATSVLQISNYHLP